MNRNETATRVLRSATIVVAADQLTKTAVSSLGDTHPAWLLPLRNHGLSFQLVTAGRWAEVALMAAVLALSAWPLIRTAQNRRAPSWAVALILGGAAGNVLDRMLFSSVRDFLPLGHLVVINVADVAIITGLATTGFTMYATRHRPAPGENRCPYVDVSCSIACVALIPGSRAPSIQACCNEACSPAK